MGHDAMVNRIVAHKEARQKGAMRKANRAERQKFDDFEIISLLFDSYYEQSINRFKVLETAHSVLQPEFFADCNNLLREEFSQSPTFIPGTTIYLRKGEDDIERRVAYFKGGGNYWNHHAHEQIAKILTNNGFFGWQSWGTLTFRLSDDELEFINDKLTTIIPGMRGYRRK